MPNTPWEQVKFGLFFGIGLAVSMGVIHFIIQLLSGARLPQ